MAAETTDVVVPMSPSEKSLSGSLVSEENEKSVSRSPSTYSIREDRWPDLVVSRPRKLDAWWLPRRDRFSPESRLIYRLARDPVIIERSNLVNISKLIVKELIETSLKYGRMLDSDHMPLQHFFIVLEHVLRHGLRPKKGLLGPKKELWDILQLVEKYSPEAQDMTSSIRDLPTVRTALGRSRAWLRMALMQKKLADYLKVLIDHKDDLLSEYFEPDALMLSEEAIVIMGLLVGLNVIDCNFCVKEEDLDCQQGVIDFSLYLRNSNHIPGELPDEELENDNMTTVLDQKNYIEELNRHLNATVTNLQTKVESLTTTNALMKEDLSIARNSYLALQYENKQLKKELGIEVKDPTENGKAPIKISETTVELEEVRSRLESEKKHRLELEKEVDLQISIKSEMEVAMKLLEKDIHEKQDTIVSLRRQLDDIKQINLEMYKKLQECESSLRHKTELIAKLEAKTFSMTDTINRMDQKFKEIENSRTGYEEKARNLGAEAAAKDAWANGIERELKVEREWRTSLQEASISNIEKISHLHQEVDQLKSVSEKYLALQEEHYALREICTEQEKTLEELGAQLSAAKLAAVELREAADNAQQQPQQDGIAPWANDRLVSHCKGCTREFNIARRKHHCRNCGNIFCSACSDNTIALPNSAKPVRVCDDCHISLVGRYSIIR
ncbi:RUN and FYVE domain-containing protein 2-like isoform X2 [Belonocnema kinseyi]|uniref:RUN and FYVE domain-containing protein 2-like isoform X2 n=1 Tax=Belonocnema kinseyi TaxID=2817044 RepID=UPI00143D450F|nr:RUN and FYVE domain-containing protein 2-like isoform X2 [Belonocnema kinseyi]